MLKELKEAYEQKMENGSVDYEDLIYYIDEAIDTLINVKDLQPLKLSKGISYSCLEHVNDIGPLGKSDHIGSDGTNHEDRLKKYGWNIYYTGVNQVYGIKTAQKIVLYWLIDYKVTNRVNRNNILNKNYLKLGAAFGQHSKYEYMGYLIFAREFNE